MRSIKKKLNMVTAKLLEVPQDVILDLPRLTMIGNMQLYIENHRGVLHFSSQLLKLAFGKGELEVHGKDLVMRGIQTEEVFIEGTINDIKYINNDKG
ncbi:sporulation protein YqfC [Paenibacillus sp. J2TS4]|uniref:sporulation protein YqfC n=1 Tax=Paenibacillus sp. J2TS4 TaxID=2807194 RepID=UPI001B098208|nr:sporulation protein YqfC [Paenibacillus sp. J2TS4]GIP35832.1 hypothetical protein J2TS4_50420 [Paenibacillus sp. J2TS4]